MRREASLVILPSFSEGFPPIIGQAAIGIELFGDAGAPFWTAAEIAAVMAGDHAEASVATRQTWPSDYQRSAENHRAEYWDELEEHCRNGPP